MTTESRLASLRSRWDGCRKCDLCQDRSGLVWWRGSPSAKLVAIGEAPGTDEDALGEPFVGLSGKLLDRLFKDAMVSISDLILVNMVACRPSGNRKPTREELQACRPRLKTFLRIVRPDALLLIGSTAASLAGIPSISKWRGEEVDVEVSFKKRREILSFPAIATFHPSYLLRRGGNMDIHQQMVFDIQKACRLAYP